MISIKKARKGDLWFHAQECPGSHVILKASSGIIEDSDIQLAADLAALFSHAKGNKKVAVLKVSVQKLQRIQGTVPGTVSFKESEVLWAEPSRGMQQIHQKTIPDGLSSPKRLLEND